MNIYFSKHIGLLGPFGHAENNVEEDNEGGIGAVDALVAPERWALEAEAEAEEPFHFFDDSAIWRSFCIFQSVKSKEKWKRRRLQFTGVDLMKKWVR